MHRQKYCRMKPQYWKIITEKLQKTNIRFEVTKKIEFFTYDRMYLIRNGK